VVANVMPINPRIAPVKASIIKGIL
jgi:hypothetical protein